MELHQLRYVIAVAETSNFTRAAERCRVTQPSLSQQIINLERELGHKLFHRLGRKAVPTEVGAAFLPRAQRILREVEDAEREVRDSDAFERTIVVGAIPTLANALFPPLLALVQKRAPQLKVRAHEEFRDELISGVREGHLDLAVIALPIKEPQLHVETLFTEALLLVLGKRHPLASKPKIQVEDLRDEGFVMLGSPSTLSEEVRRFSGDNQFEPRIVSHCAQVATIKSLVALGEAVTILPEGTVSWEDRASLIAKPLAGRNPSRQIGVIRHELRYQSRGAEQFLTLLREHTQRKDQRV